MPEFKPVVPVTTVNVCVMDVGDGYSVWMHPVTAGMMRAAPDGHVEEFCKYARMTMEKRFKGNRTGTVTAAGWHPTRGFVFALENAVPTPSWLGCTVMVETPVNPADPPSAILENVECTD